jgi:aspartate carbamoyltransferase regulatory subunit
MTELIWINDEIKNKYDNSSFRIPLRNQEGVIVEYALVDEDNFEKVNQYKWHLNKGYAQTTIKDKTVLLHHLIFKKPKTGYVIDHINEDKLCNIMSNLREITISENTHNKSKKTNREYTSQYKGVYWDINKNKWASKCTIDKKTNHLGFFDKEIDAALQYDKYTFKSALGKNANNNKLIKFEETHNIDIEDLSHERKRNIPLNIIIKNNKFFAEKVYKGKTYRRKRRETLDEALEDLKEINHRINFIDIFEELLLYINTPITRNAEGQAIIKVKNIEVIVDDNKWFKLNRYTWSISHGYVRNEKLGAMHRYLTKAKDDQIVDHINGNKYNNLCSNLRIATHNLNGHNRKKKENCKSKYIGLTNSKNGNWRATIRENGKKKSLGTFKEEIDAAKAYNKKALEIYGDKANLNIFD